MSNQSPLLDLTPVHVVFYEEATGKIVQVSTMQRACIEVDGRPALEVPSVEPSYPRTHYVDLGNNLEVTPRATIEATWNPTLKVLSPLPIPCTLEVDGDRYQVLDGSAEFNVSGDYTLRVYSVSHLPRDYQVSNP